MVPHGSLVILALSILSPCSNDIFGGQLTAECVPEGKLRIDHLQVSSALSQCLAVPRPISPWTLLLDCLYAKVMTPFLLLWIVSPKRYISWLSLNFPQLQKKKLHNC